MPDAEKIKAKLTTLITATSPAYYQLEAHGDVVFAMYSDPARQQPMLVTLDAQANPDSRKMVLDPNAMDAKGLTAIDWFVPSPDGKMVAMSLSRNGSEDGTLHVYEVATGKEVGEPISRVQSPTAGGSLSWTADGKGFWYTRYPGPDAPAADQHFNMQVYFHHFGNAGTSDPLVLGTKDGLERVSEVYLDNRYDRPAILASVQRGDGGEWAFMCCAKDNRRSKSQIIPTRLFMRRWGRIRFDLRHQSPANAPNGKIVKLKAPYAGGSLGSAPTIFAASDVANL